MRTFYIFDALEIFDKNLFKIDEKQMTRLLKYFLILFIIYDFTFSFIQYYQYPLDGDIPNITMGYKEVLSDPFGISAISENKVYGGVNRYFTHIVLKSYFDYIPNIFQLFLSPIDSIYAACASIKLISQLTIVFALAFMVSGTFSILSIRFLIPAAIGTILFQTEGFNVSMGIIDNSTAYTFFYALSIAQFMIYLLPFYFEFYSMKNLYLRNCLHIILILYAVFLSFNGPLISPIVLVYGSMLILFKIKSKYSRNSDSIRYLRIIHSINVMNKSILFHYIWFGSLALYSIFLGKYNAENYWETLPLMERFSRLPKGLYLMFTKELGLSIVFLFTLINLGILRLKNRNCFNSVMKIGYYLLICSIIYTTLLPFGGYRSYRFYIVRNDTFIPVILSLFFIFILTTTKIIGYLPKKRVMIYLPSIVLLMIYLTYNDKVFERNACERKSLEYLAHSNQDTTLLENKGCPVFSWGIITDPRETHNQAKLLNKWHVTQREILYYQK